MYNLVSTNSQRVIKILGLLAKNEEVSIYDIMKINNCSERTAYSDISRMESDNVNGLVVNLNSKYLWTEYRSNHLIESYAFSILNNDIRVKFFFELLFYPHQDLMQYSIDLDVSTVHLNSAIKSLNEFLVEHKSEIVKDDNKYYIRADDEVSFRVMIAEYINTSPDRLNEFTTKVFPKIMYSKFTHVFDYDLSKGFMLTLEMFSNLRVQQGFGVSEKEMNEEEQFTFILQRFVEVLETNKDKLDIISTELTKFIIEKMFVNDETTINEIIELVFSVLIRHKISGFIEYIEVDRLSIFCFNFDNKYKTISNEFDILMRDLLKDRFNMNIDRVIDEIKFFTYINVPKALRIKAKNILVCSDLGKEHCYTLVSVFKSMFNDHNFIMIKREDIKDYISENNEELSFIISNFNLEISKYKTIYVSDFITTDDLQAVYESLYIN